MRLVLPIVALALVASTAQAQTATLTLDEAVALARRNNATYLQTTNARRNADAQVRTAYASLLPSVSANMSGRYQKAGDQFFQGVQLESPSDVMQSSYSIGMNYTINSAILFAPKLVAANRDAAQADVVGAAETMRSLVTQQYLTTLAAQERAALADTLLITAQGQLELARARQQVGSATIIEVRQAEVALGRAEVASLQTRNAAEVQKLRLFEQMGIAPQGDVALTTRFQIAPVTFRLDSLVELAEARNPTLLAARSRERAAGLGVRVQQGTYAPTISLSTGIGGQAQAFANDEFAVTSALAGQQAGFRSCSTTDSLRTAVGMPSLNCASRFPALTESDLDAIRASTSNFPNQFDKAPLSFSVFVSMPIFNNLQREQQLQQAMVQRDNARLNVRSTELRLRADVTQAFLNLQTALRTVELQDVNARAAREQLDAQEQRYRVGAATFLEVTQARGLFEQAQVDRLTAVYDYHTTFAQLESAVGRPLR